MKIHSTYLQHAVASTVGEERLLRYGSREEAGTSLPANEGGVDEWVRDVYMYCK